MIVETDRDFLASLSSYLTDEGYSVFVARNSRQVKRILSKNKIDVVVLGMINLKRAALSLLKWVKKRRHQIEVILINTREQLSLSIEGMKLGAFDDLLVPVDLVSLEECLKKAWTAKESKGIDGPFINRYQRMMVAATYAEADDHAYAVKVLNKES